MNDKIVGFLTFLVILLFLVTIGWSEYENTKFPKFEIVKIESDGLVVAKLIRGDRQKTEFHLIQTGYINGLGETEGLANYFRFFALYGEEYYAFEGDYQNVRVGDELAALIPYE